MYIRKTTSRQNGRTYVNYLLVESVATPKGPRQKTVCSLGNLKPRRRAEWLQLVRKVEQALTGQTSLLKEKADPEVGAIVEKALQFKSRRVEEVGGSAVTESTDQLVEVQIDKVEVIEARSVGAIHVGRQMYMRLGINEILKSIGFSAAACSVTMAMVLNRLICPKSEHAMPDWIAQTALPDLVGNEVRANDDKLYRNLDRLHPHREKIEAALAEREDNLFNFENTVYLYDLTSHYFEGQMLRNPQAKRGYSRDKRPDCKQVVVGLVTNRDGFPRAHEVFDGNRQDRTTVDEMLSALGRRVGLQEGATVVVDRGMAHAENLQQIKSRNLHYLVACRQSERVKWLTEFEEENGWKEIYREPSPTNPCQKKSRVLIKDAQKDEETYVLCLSEGRKEKDRAIREKQERRLLNDLQKLQRGAGKGRYKDPAKVFESIGRLKERYPRVARYYSIAYEADLHNLTWAEKPELKKLAVELDGGYLLKTDHKGLDGEQLWRTYILLTRVESAFRDMKSPLIERPIFHQLEHRTQTHIFLCVLAYHLLVTIEHTFREKGDHRSWETLREILQTHQVVTVVLPTSTCDELHIRRATKPEPQHQEIYTKLSIPEEPMKPTKTWHLPAVSGR